MALTYDLSTNAKWSTLAGGTHNVTIIAKADGYENSEPSTAVTVTKESAYKFKHLYDAGTIGTGAIKFRHYSQQEPSSGETWVFNTPVTYKMFGSTATYSVQFTCDGERYSTINVHYPAKGDDGQLQYNEVNVVDTAGGWINDKYRTIVLDEPATGDLLTMLQKAAVKQ